MSLLRLWLLAVLLTVPALASAGDGTDATAVAKVEQFFQGDGHTNNWAVLVCTSRFWFNYRHVANTLSVYRTVKRLGIPDSNIILMLADEIPCNARNPFPAAVFNNANHKLDLYGESVEVDYRGYDVTVNAFIQLMTTSKRLLSDARSNVLVYMTGHGGDEFLKFQDAEEISGPDLADIFEQMWQKRRYRRLLFMIDTCQASTMFERFYSPNIVAVGSSMRDENSYSHHTDYEVGVSVIDRFTYYTLEFMEHVNRQSNATLQKLFSEYRPQLIHSTPGFLSDRLDVPLSHLRITDFFGASQAVERTAHVAADVLAHEWRD